MKKKLKLSKIVVFVLMLTIIATIFVSETYSRFTTTASGSDSVVVANWSFEVNGKEIAVKGDAETIDFNLFDTIYDSDGENEETDVADGFIAPGTSGAFEFALQNTSEVTAQYGIEFEVTNTNNIPIEYSTDGSTWTNTLEDIIASEETTLAIGQETKNVVIKWRWSFDGDTDADTTIGSIAGEATDDAGIPNITVKATVNAIQAGESGIIISSKPVFPTITTDFDSTAIANGTSFNYPYAPFSYRNLDLYSGKKITKLGLPVKSVESIDENPTITLYTVKKAALANKTATTATNTYEIEVPVSQYESTTINDWVYVDLTKYNINVAEDETLAFCAQTDKMTLSFSSGSLIREDYRFICKVLNTYTLAQENENLLMDVWYQDIENEKEEVNPDDNEQTANKIFDGISKIYGDSQIAGMGLVSRTDHPYTYKNLEMFENKKLTEIAIPVKSVKALDENQTFTIYKIKADTVITGKAAELIDTYVVKAPLDQLGNSTTVNKWIYIDVTDYNICCEENETLAFSTSTDTVDWGYINLKNVNSEYTFYTKMFTSIADAQNNNLLFEFTYEDYENKKTQLKTALSGKNLSILGDSISTFSGYSNDATNTNNTIGSNAIYYNGSNIITNVNDTWWMQTANETGMNLLVNNSWSGDQVSNKGMNRAMQLHDNTGENAGTNPDIIAVYLGINDIKDGVTLANFTTNYDTMVSNIKNTYPEADVFLFTHIPYYYSSATLKEITNEDLEKFNDAIRNIAEEKECYVVDLFNDSGINSTNFKDYMGDMGLHPNQSGMDAITNTFINALNDKYLNN